MILTKVTFKQGLEAKQLSSVASGENGGGEVWTMGTNRIFFWGGRCIEFSLWCRLLFLHHTGSLVAVKRFSCPVAYGVLVPCPGIEPTFSALECGFLITGPPGKSL